MIDQELEALRAWRAFANTLQVNWNGEVRSWASHIARDGYVDEERLVQPIAFPSFARQILGFEPTEIAAEEGWSEGKPDFTPADLVTHPFVFETKSTRELTELSRHSEQVSRYLWGAADRIDFVVLTNLVGLRVYQRSPGSGVVLTSQIDLRGLLLGDEKTAATTGEARRFASFVRDFNRRKLTLEDKFSLIRSAPKWNPLIEATSSSWVLSRLDNVVELFKEDVRQTVKDGRLEDPLVTTGSERAAALNEIRTLASRIGSTKLEWDLKSFVDADPASLEGKAVRQYETHVAYYVATRLLLVRIWEDLGLLEEILRDGGFDQWMGRYDEIVADVVRHSFDRASRRYRSLFVRHQDYGWYTPSDPAYGEALYQLANTYLGAIESDILGQVYERLLERIDRKLLGQYYTPRDIISLIWDMIGLDDVIVEAEKEDRVPRVLDIATGSGGFLVHAASVLRKRLDELRVSGSKVRPSDYLKDISENLVGVEIQRFSAHLAELNMLVQLGRIASKDDNLRLPPLSIITGDTLSLHARDSSEATTASECVTLGLSTDDLDSQERALAVAAGEFRADVACGNPPYIGQKVAAALIERTRSNHPYWEQHVGHHMDYLYWFMITGVSKLREGGRFGFITTEYWLRATGAKPLRKYLAENTVIERLVLLRNFRPFEDAPGQHTLIVTGRRVPPDSEVTGKPRISRYEAAALDPARRFQLLSALRRGTNTYGVHTFTAPVSPNDLGEAPWSEVILPRDQYTRRKNMRTRLAPLDLDPEQGVLSSANRMRAGYHQYLNRRSLEEIGGEKSKHGVFLLTEEEYLALGNLTQAEQEVVRLFVNTADVLPYAAIPPEAPDRLLYLAAPEGRGSDAPFPDDMPNLKSHLDRFRNLLEAKTTQYGEDRPWWSLHRPRTKITRRPARDDRWADYAVTPNWGGGGSLAVGLPPIASVPAQGLNALLGPSDVPGSYIVGVLNSAAVQEMAETLPPGYLRRTDFMELGTPLVPDIVADISEKSIEAAECVVRMRELLAFPRLIGDLRADITLQSDPGEAWSFRNIPKARRGTIASVNWLEIADRYAIGNHKIADVRIVRDLLGLTIQCTGPADTRALFSLTLKAEQAADAVAALLKGAQTQSVRLKDIPKIAISVNPEDVVDQLSYDRTQLDDVVATYRSCRSDIDSLIDPYV